MKSKKDLSFWEAKELVYKAGDKSASAYLVLDGSAEIISADGIKLNSFGPNELFGEASLVLQSDRTVSVRAGPSGLTAKVISSLSLKRRLQKDLFSLGKHRFGATVLSSRLQKHWFSLGK